MIGDIILAVDKVPHICRVAADPGVATTNVKSVIPAASPAQRIIFFRVKNFAR